MSYTCKGIMTTGPRILRKEFRNLNTMPCRQHTLTCALLKLYLPLSYIHVYVYIYIYIHIYTYTHIHVYTCIMHIHIIIY